MDNKTKALLSKAIVIVIELRQYAIEHPNSPGRHSGLCQSAADVLVELSALAGGQADEITQLREQLDEALMGRMATEANEPCADCSGITYRQTASGKIVPASHICPSKITPPCYQPDGDGCAYQTYGDGGEPIDKCKECPHCYTDKVRHAERFLRLAEWESLFENTGLTPDDLPRAAELLKAEKEGRFVMLPCKVGDTLYTESPVKGMVTSFEAPDLAWIIANIPQFGKTVFLTHAEAEAALEDKQ